MDKNILKDLLPDNPLILEIGSSDGSDTEEFVSIFPNASIFCIEPDERPRARFMKRNFQSNVVLLSPLVVSDKMGKVKFYPSTCDDGRDYSGSILEPKEHVKYHPEIKFESERFVESVTLYFIWDSLGRPKIDFIWADVQGAEEKLISGGKNALDYTHYLYTEYSTKELYKDAPNLNRILELLPQYEVMFVEDNYGIDGNVMLRNRSW